MIVNLVVRIPHKYINFNSDLLCRQLMVKELCQRQFINSIIKVENLITLQKMDLIAKKEHLQVTPSADNLN